MLLIFKSKGWNEKVSCECDKRLPTKVKVKIIELSGQQCYVVENVKSVKIKCKVAWDGDVEAIARQSVKKRWVNLKSHGKKSRKTNKCKASMQT